MCIFTGNRKKFHFLYGIFKNGSYPFLITKRKDRIKYEHLSFFHYFLSISPYTIWQNCHFCQIVSLSPNRIRLLPFPHFSTAFSDKIIYLSAKSHNIQSLFTFSRHTIVFSANNNSEAAYPIFPLLTVHAYRLPLDIVHAK